ncbi:MAG TPA: sigma-70 family RNA polymerase sigma factor [Isosphaeraceae bacterium]|nr:sigma-70 family RNA polymerase sigma factor [Isosphaeraceae bacterium]
MASNSAGVNRKSAADESAEIVRHAIAQECDQIGLAVAAMVRSKSKGMARDQLAARIEEVLQETVSRALDRPQTYDIGRPLMPWLMGITRNILKGEASEAETQRCRSNSDEAVWVELAEVIDPPDGPASDRIDTETMLARLSPSERSAIECHYLRGLGGKELAESLGAASETAARVRVFRAVQKLKRLFAGEVTP